MCVITVSFPSIVRQGWNFGRFLVLLGFRRLYSLSGKYSPSILFPIEPEIPGTQSTRLRPQFHTESLIGKPKILTEANPWHNNQGVQVSINTISPLFFSGLSKSTYVIHLLPQAGQQCQQIMPIFFLQFKQRKIHRVFNLPNTEP